MLANSVNRATNPWPASPADSLVRSFECWGRRPSGPPADPGRNALMADNMSDSWRAMDKSEFGVGDWESGAARDGCLKRNTAAVTSSNGAIVSSLAARRIAPRTSPSSRLLDTLAARLSIGCRNFVFFCRGWALMDVAGKQASAALTLDARLDRWRLPPRWPGTKKHAYVNVSKFFRFSTQVGTVMTCSKVWASFSAAGIRDAFGTRLSTRRRYSVVSVKTVSSSSCKSLYFGIIVKVMHPGSKLVRVSKFLDMGVRVRGVFPRPPTCNVPTLV